MNSSPQYEFIDLKTDKHQLLYECAKPQLTFLTIKG